MNHRRPAFALVLSLALALALLLNARAHADVWVRDTLELRVAESQIVVRGTLESFTPTRNSHEARGTFRVLETLKGKADATIECCLPYSAMRSVDSWQKGKVEVLLFLVKADHSRINRELKNVEWAVFEGYSEGFIPLNGELDGEFSERIPTADFQFLSKPDDILKLAREAARADAASKVAREPVLLGVPWDSPIGQSVPLKAAPCVNTVVNETLEAEARQWIKKDDWPQKINGLQVLAHFKSEDNIAALRPLLTDTSSAQHRLEGRDIITTYPVRDASLKILKSWGVEATAVLSEKKPASDR